MGSQRFWRQLIKDERKGARDDNKTEIALKSTLRLLSLLCIMTRMELWAYV